MESLSASMPQRAKPPFARALRTARACRCPNCGHGPLFAGWFKLLPACPRCHLSYFPESGYYVGAMYLNFIVSAVVMAFLYAVTFPLHPLAGAPLSEQIFFWMLASIPVGLVLMHYAYSFWLSLDFWLSPWEPGVEHPLG